MTTLFPKNSNDACRMFLTSSIATRRGKIWNREMLKSRIMDGLLKKLSWVS